MDQSHARSEEVFIDGRISPAWRSALVTLFAFMFGPSVLLATTFGILAAGLVAETGWSHSSVAYGATLISLSLMLSAPLQGYLVDRLGARRLILMFAPVFGLGLIGLQFAKADIQTFYVACVLLTLAGLGIWPTSYMRVMASWFNRRLGIVIGIVTSGLSVSTMLLPILLPRSFEAIGWSNTYAILGGIVILAVWPALYVWLRSAPPTTASTKEGGAPQAIGPASGAVLKARAFWIGLALFFSFGVVNAAILVHGIAVMTSIGVAQATALELQAIVGVGLLVGRLATGWLLDRTHVRTVLLLMFVMLIAAFGIWMSPFAVSLAGVAVALGGLVIGAEFDVLGVMVRRNFAQANFGRIYGFKFAIFNLGNAIGAGTLAYLFASTGSFKGPLMGLLALCVLCIALTLSLRPDRPARDAENLPKRGMSTRPAT